MPWVRRNGARVSDVGRDIGGSNAPYVGYALFLTCFQSVASLGGPPRLTPSRGEGGDT